MWYDPVILRAVERIFAVMIGGMAIWCGHRLFLSVPEQPANGKAELVLSKDRRLLITRVGPGTFFALFGTAVVIASYYFPAKGTSPDGQSYSGFGTLGVAATARNPQQVHPGPAPLSPVKARQSLAFLSDMEAELAIAGDEAQRDWRARRFRAAKLAILERAWDPGWGDAAEFQFWLDQTSPRTPRPNFERALAVLEAKE